MAHEACPPSGPLCSIRNTADRQTLLQSQFGTCQAIIWSCCYASGIISCSSSLRSLLDVALVCLSYTQSMRLSVLPTTFLLEVRNNRLVTNCNSGCAFAHECTGIVRAQTTIASSAFDFCKVSVQLVPCKPVRQRSEHVCLLQQIYELLA